MAEILSLIASPFARTGRLTIFVTRKLGQYTVFLVKAFALIFVPPFKLVRVLQQVHFIGVKSLIVISLTGLFTGMVLGIQGYYALSKVSSETLVGAGVALSLVKELGPVLTALMVTGRAGSSMAAELGVMRISEQIDALDTMDIDPLKYLVSPRIAAALISFPLMTAMVDVIGIFGGYLTGVVLLGIDSGSYIAQMEHFVTIDDVWEGFIKAGVFSIIVSSICCFQGFTVHERTDAHGARGVGLATTSAVVLSSVTVLLSDYVLTSFLL